MTDQPKKDRSRLGRGLGALLGDYLEEQPEGGSGEAKPVPIGAIAPNPFQPRREFAEEELADLAASIRENGLLQPIVVRPAGPASSAAWELVAGERRWRAATRLGWREIPALVREVDDRTLLVLALVENLQRSGLTALEEAMGYRQLADQFGLSQQQIADAMGKDRSTVANALRLLQLPAGVRTLVSSGELTAGHARALLGIEKEQRMVELAREAVDQGWSVRETEAEVKRRRPSTDGRKKSKPSRDPAEKRLEEELQRILGTAARIHRGRGDKGRIEIPFYTAEDFERVFEIVAGRSATDVVS